jgi:signal transduction histidine kinase
MLHTFIEENQEQITTRAGMLSRERDPFLNIDAPVTEISTFLTQVSTTLRFGQAVLDDAESIISTAGRNGANMMRAGHPIVDVVQSYGDVCQAVTALAAESKVPISAAEFCVFNRCLDEAIGQAVSEYSRIVEEARAVGEVERLGAVAHELRDHLQTAHLSFQTMKLSPRSFDGLSGQLLERALANLRELVERKLSDVRVAAGVYRRETFELAPFIQEMTKTAQLHAQSRGLTFKVDAVVDGTLDGDRLLLMSAIMNLVHNALKFTRPAGTVSATVRMSETRISIALQDQCGGMPDDATVFESFSDRRGIDQSGLGLGLSMAMQVVQAHAGEIKVTNLPGDGCVFTIELPLIAPPLRPARQRRAATTRRSWANSVPE